MGLEWSLELTPSNLFLVWRYWDDRSHIRPWCLIIPTWIGLPDLLHEIGWSLEWEIWFYDVSWISFSNVSFSFLVLLLLIAAGAGWEGITWRSGTDCPALLAWASLQKDRFLSLMFQFVWPISSKIYIVICIIWHVISAQIWEKNFHKDSLKFESLVLFTCE